MNASRCGVWVATAPSPGAVAIIMLHGQGAEAILSQFTGITSWSAGRVRLVDFGGIDKGLAVVLCEGDDALAQLMPHGGPRVVRRLIDRLIELGAQYDAQPDPRATYPEAASDLEADALATLARATSPAAVDLLLAQAELWKLSDWKEKCESILTRSRVLDQLIHPPGVVVVGRPNVGKSTLTNRVLGRAASLVADLPGTTRDWVAGLAELAWRSPEGRADRDADAALKWSVAVRWMDTPGLRRSDDPIEMQAISLARSVIESAAVLIAMRDPAIDWPEPQALPRTPDIWVMNKTDTLPSQHATESSDGASPDCPLYISASSGEGIERLENRVLRSLGFVEEPRTPELWAFSPTLRSCLEQRNEAELRRYVGVYGP